MADFNSMSDIQAYRYCGADASRWAEFFCHIVASHGYIMDKGWMTTWFANAMMAMHDHNRRTHMAKPKPNSKPRPKPRPGC